MTISTIGIFRALYLGDMLCVIPTARALRRAFPQARIFLIGLPWQQDFVERFSNYFDEFVPFPGWPGLPEQEPHVENILRFLHEIRTYKFDLLLQMQGNGEITNSMCMLWGARIVCGLRKKDGYAPDPQMFPVSDDGEHEILRFLKLLSPLNLPAAGSELEFPLFENEKRWAVDVLAEKDIKPGEFVCIHPGARDKRRRWPVDNFALIANYAAHNGYRLMLTGSEEERLVLDELQQRLRAPAVNIVESYGQVGVGQLAALLSKAKLLVSNDTGVSHLAAAMKLPSVIVFSRYSDINRWRPLNTALHVGIPWEKATDPAFVQGTVEEMLKLQTAAGHLAS